MAVLKTFDFEMKREFRYMITFPESINLDSRFITRCSKPKFVNGKWLELELEFLDPVGPSTSQRLYELVLKFKNNRKFKLLSFLNKNKSLFSFEISALDPTGIEVEKWIIDVEDVTSIDFGDYDYVHNLYKSDIFNLEFKNLKPRMVIKPLNCRLI